MKRNLFTLTLFVISIYANGQLSWLQLPDYPGTGRSGTISFSINGKGYIGLGLITPTTGSTDLYEYDPTGNSWTQKASLPSTGRWSTVSFAIGNKGYVTTGSVNGTRTKQTWEYDPIANAWTSKAAFPGTARQDAAGFVIGNKGYVGTGYDGSATFDFYEYDPSNNTWTPKADFPGPERGGAAGFTASGKGYIGLGNSSGSTSLFRDVYEYNATGNTWLQVADFPIPYVVTPATYSSVNGFVLCGYYYQYTGITHNPLNMLYKYDPAANDWTLEGTFPGYPRGYTHGFTLGNDIYICGGAQNNTGAASSLLHDFWKLSNGLNLSVQNLGASTDFIIFPNPVTDFIQFENQNILGKVAHIRIYDSVGKLISEIIATNSSTNFDVSTLNSGLYFVELVTIRGEVLDSRFVKE